MFQNVAYICLPVFIHVYLCLLVFTMFTSVYLCIPMFTFVYTFLPMSVRVFTKFTYAHPYSCLPCLPSCTKRSSTGVNKGSVQKLVHKS